MSSVLPINSNRTGNTVVFAHLRTPVQRSASICFAYITTSSVPHMGCLPSLLVYQRKPALISLLPERLTPSSGNRTGFSARTTTISPRLANAGVLLTAFSKDAANNFGRRETKGSLGRTQKICCFEK